MCASVVPFLVLFLLFFCFWRSLFVFEVSMVGEFFFFLVVVVVVVVVGVYRVLFGLK